MKFLSRKEKEKNSNKHDLSLPKLLPILAIPLTLVCCVSRKMCHVTPLFSPWGGGGGGFRPLGKLICNFD
jgi:hypothetical protein